jgi:hypothetical protein
MRASRIGGCVVVALLAGCQETDGPTEVTGGSGPAFSAVQASEKAGHWLVRFDRLTGNDVTGAAGQIRGQNAAGAPWRLQRGEARLSQRGELRVRVRGLVLQATGVNPVAAFKAILSCQTPDAGALVNVNLSTATVPVGPNGNAEIRERLSGIPSPCYAPIVFVTSAGGNWFAVSTF